MKRLISILLFACSIFALEYYFTHKNIEKTEAAEIKKAEESPDISTAAKPNLRPTEISADEKIRDFFANVPKVSELKNLSDSEVHEMSEPVRIAGESLSEMRKFFTEHPQPAVVEMNFYMKCSADRDLFDSVRAICAARVSRTYSDLTGRKISPQIFGRRIAALKERVSL